MRRLVGIAAVAVLLLSAGFGLRARSSRACSSTRPALSDKISQIVPSTSVTDRLYAVTSNGIVFVTNGGSSWRKIPQRLPGSGIVALGRKKDLLFSGDSPGLFASQDGAQSWRSLSCDWIVTDIAGSPGDPRTVYVGTAPDEGGEGGGGLYRSTDEGATWTRFTAIPRVDSYDLSVDVVAVKPGAPQQVYIAMESGGIVSSSDGGEHWRFNSMAHEDASGNPPQVNSLAFGPGPQPALWAGTRFKGVFSGDEFGRHWTQRGLPGRWIDWVVPDQRLARIVFVVTDDGRILRTIDGGLNWHPITGLPKNAYDLAVQPRDDSLYAWTARTVFRSRNHGVTWKMLAPLPG